MKFLKHSAWLLFEQKQRMLMSTNYQPHQNLSGFSGVWKTWKTWKNQGIFSDQEMFCTLVVFTPPLSIHISDHFLGLSTTRKNVENVGEFLKICSGKLGKVREIIRKQS